jgi:hypothetical protein
MAALFEGLPRIQRIALLGRLEMAGGQVYRALAADEKNVQAREALLRAAGDEERNGELLGADEYAEAELRKVWKGAAASDRYCVLVSVYVLRRLRRGSPLDLSQLRRLAGAARGAADALVIGSNRLAAVQGPNTDEP